MMYSDNTKREKNVSFITIRWLLVTVPFSPTNARVYIVDDVLLLYELNVILVLTMKRNIFIFHIRYNISEHFIFSWTLFLSNNIYAWNVKCDSVHNWEPGTKHRTHTHIEKIFIYFFIPFNGRIKWWNIKPSNRHGSWYLELGTWCCWK